MIVSVIRLLAVPCFISRRVGFKIVQAAYFYSSASVHDVCLSTYFLCLLVSACLSVDVCVSVNLCLFLHNVVTFF